MSFHARPAVSAADGPTGAYVACWIRALSAGEAQTQAEKDIRSEGWVVETVEEPAMLAHPQQSDKEYLEQAALDGEVYVYHTWTGTDDERVH